MNIESIVGYLASLAMAVLLIFNAARSPADVALLYAAIAVVLANQASSIYARRIVRKVPNRTS
jgi:hypothetical protein